MDLVEVYVVDPQPTQRIVDGLHDVLTRQATTVWPLANRKVDLGGQHHFIPAGKVTQSPTGDFFADAKRVHIGRVKEVDAQLQRALDDRAALVFRQNPVAPLRRAVGHHPQANA